MRLMTYNVHSCIDMQGKNSLIRIAELLQRERIAVAGLNEIEACSPRTRFVNQPKALAAARDMVYQFGPTIKLGPIGFFGNAILSRYNIYEHKNIRLPGSIGREPRYCLLARLRLPDGYLTIMCTHLGLNRNDRAEQIAVLTKIAIQSQDPLILMGDFNSKPDELTPLLQILTDTGALFGAPNTYPADNPQHRIDYILISPQITCTNLYVPPSDASDHLPVIADLQLP